MPDGSGDMFLMVKGQKSGKIKGESQDADHKGEIDVLSWSWGLQSQPAIAGAASGRASIHELRINKLVDSASTALMSALRSNEMISQAVLTIRKSGKLPLEFLKVTIEDGRVTALNIEGGDLSGGSKLFEHVSFSFNKITVEYTPQGPDGRPQGGMMYQDQWNSTK